LWGPTDAFDTAVSPEHEGASAARIAADVVREQEQSVALFGDKDAAISELWEVLAECADPGWDGDEAEAVDRNAATNAAALIRSIPHGLPMPEVAADPDGEISLDWIAGRDRLLTISVDRSNRLAYAWVVGAYQGRAVIPFGRGRFPEPLSQLILDIHKPNHAPVRVA